jgi:Ca-activated chloride channel family protein
MQQPSGPSSSSELANKVRMSLHTDRTLLQGATRSTRYLLVNINAPTAPRRKHRLPLNVGIVLDRSGSMDGERKFVLARDAVQQSLNMLREGDRFTLVVFDDQMEVLAAGTLANSLTTRAALNRLSEIEPRGGTDLHTGWTTGASHLLLHTDQQSLHNTVNRVLLLTDGQANHGLTDPAALTEVAKQFHRRGVATSTFGVGSDFDERLLRDIAREGGGQFYYIESPVQIADLLTSELGDALEVVRRNVTVRVMFPPGADAELLNSYNTVRAPGGGVLNVQVGDFTSGQELQLVFRLTFPEDREGATATVQVETVAYDTRDRQPGVPMSGTDDVSSNDNDAMNATGYPHVRRTMPDAEGALVYTYAGRAANEAGRRNVLVDREVAQLYAARARLQASECNRYGDYKRARRVLEATAQRIKSYANGDAELEQLWRALLADIEKYATVAMSVGALKQSVFAYENRSKNRDGFGKARKQRE